MGRHWHLSALIAWVALATLKSRNVTPADLQSNSTRSGTGDLNSWGHPPEADIGTAGIYEYTACFPDQRRTVSRRAASGKRC